MTQAMVRDLLSQLRGRGQTLAVAESCTGGLLGGAITGVAGAGDVFLGGVVAYHDRAKRDLLGVDEAKLGRQGAVSAAVVEAMANGVRDRFGADVALAVSGVAGPTGGTREKPVGTVWIGVLGPGPLMDAQKFHFEGDRDDVRHEAVRKALEMGLEAVREAEKEQVA